MGEVGVGRVRGEGPDDAAVEGDFGCEVGEVEGPVAGGVFSDRVEEVYARVHLQLRRQRCKPFLQSDLGRFGPLQDHACSVRASRFELLDRLKSVESVENVRQDGGQRHHVAEKERTVADVCIVLLRVVRVEGLGEILFYQVLDGPVEGEDVGGPPVN